MNPEAQLAGIVVTHFRGRGFRVGAEVEVPGYADLGRIDVLAQSSSGFWAIHVKTHLGFDVASQAFKTVPYCHRTYVAVPQPETTRAESHAWLYARHVLERDNIGVLVVSGKVVTELVRPRGTPDPAAIGLEILAEHETSVAGNDQGQFHHKRSGVKAELLAKLETIDRPVRIGKLTADKVLQRWLVGQLEQHPEFEALRMSGMWYVRRREAA